MLPLLGDDIVASASLLKLVFFTAEAAEHVDEALVVTDGLPRQLLIGWVTLLLQHKLVLVVEQENIGPVNQEYTIVRRVAECRPSLAILPVQWVESSQTIHFDVKTIRMSKPCI